MTPRAESSARRGTDTPGRHGGRGSGPLTVEQILSLPASVDIETTARALNIGRDKAHRLVRSGQFPITVLELGRKHRCRLIDICEFLGIPSPAATP